ncbi:MAG: helix-turn-helix domain-containing protein [Clostridia bacterium]|nr:helix-turn-helix domain-containing protein [Clostridia bacterium]
MQKTYLLRNYTDCCVAAERKWIDCPLHWHDCCEVELVLSGKGRHIVNDVTHPFGEGYLYLLTPADCHVVHTDEPGEVIGVMFEDKLVSDELYGQFLTLEQLGQNLIVHLEEPVFGKVRGYLEAILQEVDNRFTGTFSETYVSRLLDCVLIELLRALDSDGGVAAGETMRRVILWLHRHYTENVTLPGLAAELHLNPNYLSRLFHEATGQTFKQYLTALRLRHACRLLANTEQSVTEICYACGFDSYSNFSRSFRRTYHVSPTQFRQKKEKSC